MPAKVIVTATAAPGLGPLRRIFSELPRGLDAAILVVQHPGAVAGTLFAKMLRDVTPLTVVTPDRPLPLESSTVYVFPPDRHARVAGIDLLGVDPPRGGHRRGASLHAIVESAVAFYGPDTVGLEVMGGCGWTSASLVAIRSAGGVVVAQDEGSHPGAAGHAHNDRMVTTTVLPLAEISYMLRRLVEAGPVRQLPAGVS